MEDCRSRSQSESLPSTAGGLTPTLDKSHKRVPSDCSSSISIIKPTLTPSTTASNSPSNMFKLPFTSQEKGLGSIMEIEGSYHSGDESGTESERDRIRQLEQKEMSISPRAQHNLVNAELHRAPGDGSPCDVSHQSLAAPAGPQYMFYSPMIGTPDRRLLPSDPRLMSSDSRLTYNMSPSRRSTGGEVSSNKDAAKVYSR